MKKNYTTDIDALCKQIEGPVIDILDLYLPLKKPDASLREKILKETSGDFLVQNSPSIVTVIDYENRGYLYVSDRINLELNTTAENLLNEGLVRAFAVFEDTHRDMFIKHIYPTIFEYFAAYAPTDEAKDLTISYNTLLETTSGEYAWYDHRMSVLKCNDEGFPIYALKILTNIDLYKKDELMNFRIYKKRSNSTPQLLFSKDYGFDITGINISEREKDVLRLVAQGLTSVDIADRLNISAHTVSTHRKNILKKTNTKSILELMNFAIKNGII